MTDEKIGRMTLREPLRIYTEQTSDLGGIWAFKPYAMTHVEFVEVSDYEAQRDLVAVQAAELTRLRAQIAEARDLLSRAAEALQSTGSSYPMRIAAEIRALKGASEYDRARAVLTTRGDTP